MSEIKYLKKVFANIFVFVSICVLSFGKVNGLSPFSYAFFYGAVARSTYLLSGVLSLLLIPFYDGIGYGELILTIASLIPFCFVLAYEKATKKKLNKLWNYLFCIINFCLISVMQSSFAHVVHLVVNGVLVLSFSYVFSLSTSMLDSAEKLLSSDTALGVFAFVFLSFGAGFSGIRVFSTPLLFVIAGFCIPFISCVAGKGHGVVCALSLGCGYAVCYYEVDYIALFAFCALCCVLFSSSVRIFPFFSSLMGITVFELYFAVDYSFLAYHLIFYAIGGIAFLLVPKKIIEEITKQRREISGGIALRFLINKNRVETANSLRSLREIFMQMSTALSSLKGDTDKVSLRLAQKTEECVCRQCERYKECGSKQLGNALLSLSRLTLIKNKATITSLPPLLEKECIHLSSLVGSSYNNSLTIRKEVMRIATQNQVKSSLSSSLADICQILQANEKMVSKPIGFDYEREEKIKEELALGGIVCKQVYLSLGNEFEVMVLVKKDKYIKEQIEKIVGEVLKIPVVVNSENDSIINGWKVVNLIEKPLFTLVGGVSSSAKQGDNTGDSHSFIALSDYTIMTALCDGMGSGEKASKASDSALSLIEGFYRAGFSHDVAIKSINSFLRSCDEESFSALDVMIFDRREGRADIVKLASAPTYIKKETHTIRIDASSLPLGIVGQVNPSISSRNVENGDCFVFVSDGVSDCFSGDELSSFINNLSSHNPSVMAQTILERAKQQKSKQTDDMTVLVCKVIINY